MQGQKEFPLFVPSAFLKAGNLKKGNSHQKS
jgi:hypothetical protein